MPSRALIPLVAGGPKPAPLDDSVLLISSEALSSGRPNAAEDEVDRQALFGLGVFGSVTWSNVL